MKRFISLPFKILVVTVSALLIISIGLTSLSLIRIENEFNQHQQEKTELGKQQFEQHNQLLKNQLRIWLESFADMSRSVENESFEPMADRLKEQYEALQLHLNVENVWLFNEQEEVLYSSTQYQPKYMIDNVRETFASQEPKTFIACEQTCLQLVTVPILNANGELGVTALTASLVDMFFYLKQSLNSELAVVKVSADQNDRLSGIDFISYSTQQMKSQIIKALSTHHDFQLLIANGIKVDAGDENFLINFMPLTEHSQVTYYLIMVEDLSQFIQTLNDYKRQVIIIASIIFIGLAGLIYLVTYRTSLRLLSLANSLPLLAEKRFEEFRLTRQQFSTHFPDELDVLNASAREVSIELEEMHSQIEQNTQELENIAMYDLLTGLPNRNMLNYQLKKFIAAMSHQQQYIVAVLFLDLDDFKKVNDSHGHEEGDKLLIEASTRLKSCVKPHDVVCRFGGDEYVILLPKISKIEQAYDVAEKVLATFNLPIHLGSEIYYVSTSIGISFTDDNRTINDDLIRQADMAMYEAKDTGGNCFQLYNTDMYQRVANRVMIESEVRLALQLEQFSLSLQPQIDLSDGKLFGFEALLRWYHPERGMVSPDDFIPVIESSEHMIELGYWVIKRSFELAIKLIEQGLPDIRIAINLSAGQFRDVNLTNFLEQQLAAYQLPAKHFELELTERTLVKDVDKTLAVMNQLRALGFTFSIDDFGTGYSSLSYLKQMPVDSIKIDKSFVFGMLENEADYQITISTIAMVQNMGMKLVAEGVENSAQLRVLKQYQCDYAQGYFFAKPIPEKELFTFIDNHFKDGYFKNPFDQVS